jgi:Cell wall-associated hydrolases (invasion-associated proteins)
MHKNLIGIPFADGGRDIRTGFDCYGLAIEVYRRMGIELPEYYSPAFDSERISGTIDEAKSMPTWELIDKGELTAPALVIIKLNSPLCNHVGVYIGNGLFIHCRNPIGVNIDRINSPAWRHRIDGFVKLKEGNDENR